VAVRVERAGSMAQGEKGKEIKPPLLMIKGVLFVTTPEKL